MPCSYKVRPADNLMQDTDKSFAKQIGSIKGTINKLGQAYFNARVILYNKENLQPIAARKPNHDGGYEFLGLNNELKTFIVAFDNKQQFNAVIQDHVVPK